MRITIKATPEDFKVEEIAQLPLVPQGAFCVYRLEKRGWNTIDALRELSRNQQIPLNSFSYGGKKDRHAHTSQFIAIEGPRIKDVSFEHLKLTFHGIMDRPMGPDLIEANRFEIAVRQLSGQKSDEIVSRIAKVKEYGFPNYFDDQRFGSFDADQGFLAEKLLLGHLNGAVKIYLTSVYQGDPTAEKKRRSFFLEHWKNWKMCATQAYTPFERQAFADLAKGEKESLTVLNRIPQEELSMYFSAFQSFLWNEVARAVIKDKISRGLIEVDGVTGDYIFYEDVSAADLSYLKNLVIPGAAHNTQMPDELCSRIYAGLLESRGIQKPMFNKIKIRRAFFKATDRKLIVVPFDLAADVRGDDLYVGKKMVVLKFTLPRGSYATMLIKRLLV